MADYEKDAIIKDYKENGNGRYASFHAARLKAAKEGGNKFPALMTLRKWLEDAKLLERVDKDKKVSSESLTVSKGKSGAPLSEQEKSEFDVYDKNLFAAWVASERPAVWREYYSDDMRTKFLLDQKDREIADLKKQLEEAKRK